MPSRIYKAEQDPETGEVRIVEITDRDERASSGFHFMPKHSGPQKLSSNNIDYIKERSRYRAQERDKRMVEVIGNGGKWKP